SSAASKDGRGVAPERTRQEFANQRSGALDYLSCDSTTNGARDCSAYHGTKRVCYRRALLPLAQRCHVVSSEQLIADRSAYLLRWPREASGHAIDERRIGVG